MEDIPEFDANHKLASILLAIRTLACRGTDELGKSYLSPMSDPDRRSVVDLADRGLSILQDKQDSEGESVMESELDYHKRIGHKLFQLISDDLNRLSKELRPLEHIVYRRQEDLDEMCVALSLLAQHLDLNTESL